MKRGLYVPPRHFGSNGGFFGRKRDTEQDNDDTLLSSIAVHLITFPNVLFTTRTLPRTKAVIFGGLNWSWMFFWRNRLSQRDKKLYQVASDGHLKPPKLLVVNGFAWTCCILPCIFGKYTVQHRFARDWIFMYGYLAYPILSTIKDDSLVPLDHLKLGWFLCLKLSQRGIKLLHPLCTVLVWPGGCGFFIHVLLRQKSHASGSGQDLIKGRSGVFCF